ncbi:glycosyltransferase [Dysgonomonas sp. 520]|uniref:glycosyltransferase n=1 Tax=Dysgonomonas sp. 520 TaxID=2302931 RepID=UPI0013D2F81E|nr:glycosyltransferase [Dysgonomonas sp. 520]NDW09803.1 glycosyltransferase [Dysgonomonas sp. 520]
MKIVTLSSKDSFGGAAKVACRIHEQLDKMGVDNKFIVNSKRSANNTSVRIEEFHKPKSRLFQYIERLKLVRGELNRRKLWKKYAAGLKDAVVLDLEVSLLKNTLEEVEKKYNFDILHLHWVGDSFVNFTEFKNLDKPVVWTLHDCFAFTGICTYFEDCDKYLSHCQFCPQLGATIQKDLSYITFEQKKERYSDINFHIVCPSNWLADHARKSVLLKNFPVSVIPNGIDTDYFYPIDKKSAKKSLGINPDKKVILFGGIAINKDERKGGALLTEALRKLAGAYRQDEIELLILGVESGGNLYGEYKATYLGYVDNEFFMRIAYSAADITILPSKQENLSTTIMESMSCATAVVAFNIGGNSDMVDHKQNGYLAKPYNTGDLKDGIVWCLSNNDENELGNAARQKVLDNFRIEDITKRYVELYGSLVK